MTTSSRHRALPSLARSAALAAVLAFPGSGAAEEPFRPPSIPLVVHDPYFSIWCPADRLTDASSTHWTGKTQALEGLVRVDGKCYRILGIGPAGVPALAQTKLELTATRTVVEYASAEIRLTFGFTTPALPEDLDLLSRPLTYVSWELCSSDGKEHEVDIFFSASASVAVDKPEDKVVWAQDTFDGLTSIHVGSEDQAVLRKRGDDLRIDWGYFHAAARSAPGVRASVASASLARTAFASGASPAPLEAGRMPVSVREGDPALVFTFALGRVGPASVSRTLMLAYDDIWSILYMGQRLRPYWRRAGLEASGLLREAARDEAKVIARSRAFDAEFKADLERAGGPKFARIAILAYRQCLAGNKLAADAAGMPLFFPKENFSNGCIATVDVIYPMAPLFLLFGPDMAKASLMPILSYAASGRWKFPFAPHDLGTYPHATGQVYGGGEETEENQMPVEESGNMLILAAAIAKLEGTGEFARAHWREFTLWAEYLREKGFDPENQLCTDDFAGHLAHNVNLSAKAIIALGAYAQMAKALGKVDEAARYRKLAEDFAARWEREGLEGDHYRLAFDKAGTWSQKYNLAWDSILDLRLFPAEVMRKEMAYYRKIQARYGLPLDNRSEFTKLDWILWTATLTGSRDDFDALVAPVHDFLQATPDRVPMTDWYWTGNAKVSGFRARPVVGGVFLKCLAESELWTKWARRGPRAAGSWAPLPRSPETKTLVPTSQSSPVSWRYRFESPEEGWNAPGFDASKWKEGPGGFGTAGTPGARVGTAWASRSIWLRREFELSELPAGVLELRLHHDEDAEVYLNGVLAARERGFTTGYELVAISEEAARTLKVGKNVLAIRCRQTIGGQYIDCGIDRLE